MHTPLFITVFTASPSSFTTGERTSYMKKTSTKKWNWIRRAPFPTFYMTNKQTIFPIQNVASSSSPSERNVFARGETFSRRRIGMYELKREGVDPNVLLKRTYRFELIYGIGILTFISTFFIIPVTTHIAIREDIVASFIAIFMGCYAIDTLSLNGLFTSTIVASFSNRKRVARHEAAHFIVAHLLGFKVEHVILPTPKNTWLFKQNRIAQPGVGIGNCFAQDDAYRIAAVGLAGLAAELLIYHNAYGVEDDMAQVSRKVRASLRNENDHGNKNEDENVKHVIRWGLLVATRMVKQHCVAYNRIVEALLNGADYEECRTIVDELANSEHLVEEPFGPTI